MKKILFGAILALTFLIQLPADTKAQSNSEACYDFQSCAPEEIVNSCFESDPNGCVDWENGIIYAVGIGVPNPKFESESQKNYSAVRAATVIAQRNLLEIIEGVNIDSETTVKDGVLENDQIRSSIQGRVKRAQPIGRASFLNDGSVAITVRYFMNDLFSLVSRKNPYGKGGYKKPSNPRMVGKDPYGKKGESESSANEQASSNSSGSSNGTYSGLIIDTTGLELLPALSPKVLGEGGEVVYGEEKTGRNFNVSQGITAYAKSINDAKKIDRIGENPIIVKAIKASGKTKSDAVIDQSDVENLNSLYNSQSFLREGRVAFVVD